MDRLFVYGTLRRGEGNAHARELAEQARWVGAARIRGRLFRVAHYPGLAAPAHDNEWVSGDLFEGVTDGMFQKLDEYEGREYTRQIAEVMLEDGRVVACYLYLYALDTDGLEPIPSGDWWQATSPSSRTE